ELVPRDLAGAIDHEVCEHDAALPAADGASEIALAQADDERGAELDAPLRGITGFEIGHRCTGVGMGRIIVCECGTVVRGADEQELLRGGRVHMQTNHPAIAEQITDAQLLALSHEDPSAIPGPVPASPERGS